jgi:hypothetical protein
MLLLALMPNYWNGAERRGKREELQRFKTSKKVSRGKGDSRIFDSLTALGFQSWLYFCF